MKKIIIGGVAVLIGVSGFSNFFFTFLGIIAGMLPIILIIGGALAFYLGYTDIQTEKDKPEAWAAPAEPAQDLPEEPKPKPSAVAEEPIEPTSKEDPAPEEDTESEEANFPSVASAASTASAAPAFKGNAETLVFHSIDCKFSKGKKCTVEFATREEAIDQGYKPCKVCKA